jgi:hypothetical protein
MKKIGERKECDQFLDWLKSRQRFSSRYCHCKIVYEASWSECVGTKTQVYVSASEIGEFWLAR